MSYPILLTLHLFAALIFIGTVFFEVLIFASVRRHVPPAVMREVEQGVGRRVRRLIPWALLVLFSAGLGMVWVRYLPFLADPLASSFGTLLTLKITLALSVLGHFFTAMFLLFSGRMTAARSRRIHLSVFTHMVGIVLLAKGMFYLSW